jgi:MarR family transcriptional regulator, negative regulator of the multidrug operon emrRAB
MQWRGSWQGLVRRRLRSLQHLPLRPPSIFAISRVTDVPRGDKHVLNAINHRQWDRRCQSLRIGIVGLGICMRHAYNRNMKHDQLANIFGAMALSAVTGLQSVIEASASHSISHCAALFAVVQHPELSIDMLRQILQLSHSGTVRVVDRLAVAGLVRRSPGCDGRTIGLTATRAGIKLFKVITAKRLEKLAAALGNLSQEEKVQLGAISAKLLFGSATSRIQAQRVCRLCDHSVCHGRGSCPVTEGVNAD